MPPRNGNSDLEKYISATALTLKTIQPLKPHRNLSNTENAALKELRQDSTLVIKKADKGACIIVESVESYVNNGLTHLQDTNIYQPLDGDPTPALSRRINQYVDELHDRGFVDKDTRNFLIAPEDVRTQRLYFLKKIHKTPHGIRPIVSGCNGPTENISAYIDYYIKPLVPQIPSHIRDSGHLVSILENTPLPQDILLVTIDVSSLYTNIPHDDGIKSVLGHMYPDTDCPIPESLFRYLLEIVLKCNVFEFNGTAYKQIQGTAMGTKMAPSYANIFMDDVEQEFLSRQPTRPHLWLRYIDDILCIWPSSNREELMGFLEALNSFHPTLRFTWAISDTQVDFLDITLYKGSRFLTTGLLDMKTYFKPTNTFQYLEYSSAHPHSVFKGLVKGECIRFLRSTSDPTNYQSLITTLHKHLRLRNYPTKFIDPIIKSVPFSLRTSYVTPSRMPEARKGPIFVTNFSPWIHPRAFTNALTHNWTLIENDTFPQKPMIAYRRNKTIANSLVRARLPGEAPPTTDRIPHKLPHIVRTVTPCNHSQCKTCPILLQRNVQASRSNSIRYRIPEPMTCKSACLVYCIECMKCGKQYIGQTSKTLRLRIRHHRAAAREHREWPIYRHFRGRGHDFERDFRVIPLERCRAEDLLTRERHFIELFKTTLPHGLNSRYQ